MAGDHAGAFGLAAAGARARIGRYQVTRRLAVGGMAELFLARSVGIEGFEKQVVIKRILPQYARNAQMVEMFLDEARLAARIHHPNIAQVFDIGEDEGEYFFTMEYIHGEDLGALMTQCAGACLDLPLEHALTIAIGAAAGLHHAHGLRDDRGRLLHIVHRDVSPANVMVGFDGGVKLVDFGIAKARSRVHTTSTGGLKGKFAYMSPEQCRGEELDKRSDIFSLGIVLYELTTGMPLFDSSSAMRAMQQVQTGQITPPSRTRADYPAELEAIVLRALRPAPAERYQNAGELQLDLEAFARERKLPISSLGLGAYLCELFADHAPPDETLDRTADHVVPLEVALPNRAAAGDAARHTAAAATPMQVSTSAETALGTRPAPPPDDAPGGARYTEVAGGPPPITHAPALGARYTEVAGGPPPITHAPGLYAEAASAVTVVGTHAAFVAGAPGDAPIVRPRGSGVLGVVVGVFLGIGAALACAIWLGGWPGGDEAAASSDSPAATRPAPRPSPPSVRPLATPAGDDAAAARASDDATRIGDVASDDFDDDDDAARAGYLAGDAEPDAATLARADDDGARDADDATTDPIEPAAIDIARDAEPERRASTARVTTPRTRAATRRRTRARQRRARDRDRPQRRAPDRDTEPTEPTQPTKKPSQWNLDSPLPPEG